MQKESSQVESSQVANVTIQYPSFLALLALLFIGLKLGGVIDWSWWLVLCPLWGPFALVILIIVFLGIILGCCRLVQLIFTR